MNTAEKLEAITDRAKFELLVTSVLRKDNRDYAAIVHTGINAQGETIRSPLDGFCLVSGSVHLRFILVEHTTTDRDGLEKKWLYDHSTAKSTNVSESKDGDGSTVVMVISFYNINAKNSWTVVLTRNDSGESRLHLQYSRSEEFMYSDNQTNKLITFLADCQNF